MKYHFKLRRWIQKKGGIKLNMPFENALKKALNTPLPEKEVKRAKKKTPWLGLPLDLDWFSDLFRKKPL